MKQQQIFQVDKITNSIEDVITGKSINTLIAIVKNKEELKHVLKKNNWLFSWKKEYIQPGRQIYKLVVIIPFRA